MMAVLAAPGADAAWFKRSKPPKITAPAGLVEVPVRGFQHSFIRPEADLATPRPVCIEQGEFALDPKWERKHYGRTLQAADLQRIETDFRRAVQSEFDKAFRDQAGFTLAASRESCQLRIVVSIQDLYLNAPEAMTSTSNRTYARSIGHMRLKIAVLDITGGTLLAEAHGFRADPNDNWNIEPDDYFNETNRVTEIDNIDFARDTARAFAEYTRTRLLIVHPRG